MTTKVKKQPRVKLARKYRERLLKLADHISRRVRDTNFDMNVVCRVEREEMSIDPYSQRLRRLAAEHPGNRSAPKTPPKYAYSRAERHSPDTNTTH